MESESESNDSSVQTEYTPLWEQQFLDWYVNFFIPWNASIAGITNAIACTWTLVFLCLGVVGNTLILCFMPKTSGISFRAKLFYVPIAFADLSVLCLVHLYDFASEGLLFINPNLSHDLYSHLSAPAIILIYVLWDVSKYSSAYFLVVFSAHRAFVVSFPIMARKIDVKATMCHLCAAAAVSIVVPCVTTLPYVICTVQQPACPWKPIAVGLTNARVFILAFIPLPVIAMSTVVVPIVLLRRMRTIASISASAGESKSSLSAAEVRNSLTAFLVALFYVCFVGIYHSTSAFSKVFTQLGARYAYQTYVLREISVLCEVLSAVAYSINPYIYMFMYPNFRLVLYNALFR